MRGFLYLMLGLAAYGALLVLSQTVLSDGVEGQAARLLLALLPMLPALFICWVVVRSIRQLDELQRRVQLEALAVAFAGTALITFGYGFLEGVGLPRLSMFLVWPVMASFWFVGVMVGRFRFR
ncbi:hypothetical protein [Allosediminivita pacifica]|uniref:Transmembrane protein n=1 Tax=Allosediminivita pacifica TaxID=1267769 RepID=A0A2T6AS39_9RHOB|nr:hypothetical protein [Allosediminivita pacifica]PTX46637.1 hypothetical protein C8N44_1154 [Allosediminivita pacifica]